MLELLPKFTVNGAQPVALGLASAWASCRTGTPCVGGKVTLNREHPAGPNFPDLPRRIEDIVASDDPIFVEVLKQAAKRLGAALGEAIAILDPELVLLGGGILQKLGDSFVETLVLEIPKSAMPTKPLPPVKSSSFGADAGVIGAATLVLHDAYAPSLQLLNLI